MAKTQKKLIAEIVLASGGMVTGESIAMLLNDWLKANIQNNEEKATEQSEAGNG